MSSYEDLDRQIEQFRSRDSATLVDLRNLLLEIEEFINSEGYQALSPAERSQLQSARKDLIQSIQGQEGGADQPANGIEELPAREAMVELLIRFSRPVGPGEAAD